MLRIERVNYENSEHAAALIELLDHYAQDPMGGGEALPAQTRAKLITEMAARSTVFSFIVWHPEDGPVGLINCVEGFSTFAAKSVCNLHDIAVREGYRGQNIGQKLIAAAAEEAKKRGCVKLTLEVLSGNEPARLAYLKFGFKPYQLDPEMGHAEFWEFKL